MESQRLKDLTENVLKVVAYNHGFTDPRLNFSNAAKKAENFVGQVYRFVLTDSDDTNKLLEVVVKLPPANEVQRTAIRVDEYFHVETHMYREVLPALAECYKKKNLLLEDAVFPCTVRTFALHDEGQDQLIVMEDLKPKGFYMGSRLEGLDETQCRLVLKNIARLHGASLALQRDNPQLHNNLTENLIENLFHREEISESFKLAIENFRNQIDDRFPMGSPIRNKIETFLENYQANMKKIVGRNSTLSCIVHGDLWVNNILFKCKEGSDVPEEVCFVDLQMSRMTSPIIDLAYLLAISTSDETFHLYMDYIQYYHKALCSALEELGHDPEEIVPWKLFEEELRKYGRYGWGIAVILLTLMHMVDEDIDKLRKLPGHFAQTHHLVKKKNSDKIKRRFIDIVEQAEQLGFL